MTAHILRIEERHLRPPGALASLADFTCTEGEEVDPRVVTDNPDISLYCLDDETKRAVFVHLPQGTDLTRVPFVYLTQGEQAERPIAVSYDTFLQLAAELPRVENLISIFNTGRSGSTLLSHVFNESGTVMSLSEPTAADQFAFLREADGSRDAELATLIDGTVRFLFKPNPYNQNTTCALKFRGEAIPAMDLYGATFAGAKNLFLYRDAVGWATSFYRLLKGWGGAPDHQPLSEWLPHFERFYGKDAGHMRAYLGGGDEDIPLIKFCAYWWLLPLEAYLAQHERGVRALAVRYDDLNTHREAVLREIFAYCDLPISDVEKGLRAFERDAQAGTPLARADSKQGNVLRLNDSQLADIHDVIKHHPVINTPDFVLPGTLRV